MKKSNITKIASLIFSFVMILCSMFIMPTTQTISAETTPNYLTLTAKGGTAEITFKYYEGTDVQYSLNGGEWTNCKPAQDETGDVFTLTENQYVQFKGTNVRTWCQSQPDEIDDSIIIFTPYHFSMVAKSNGATVEASGDVTSLTNGVGGNAELAITGEYQYMFHNCAILTKAPNLPSTTLSDYCYASMFSGCSSLTTAPKLSATTLATNCYGGMFKDCSSLVNAPELPATELAYGCYGSMFYGCSSLTIAPELPATTLAYFCYGSMFQGCSSLTIAPDLPATELAYACYDSMFSRSGLLKPVDISHVKTLAEKCFDDMYNECTKIVMSTTQQAGYTIEWKVPNISTATDWNSEMFRHCGSTNCCDTHNGGTSVAVNTTYYVAKYYNIAYDLNGGSGTIPTENNKYCIGNDIDCDDGAGISNGNMIFKGWASSSSATKGETKIKISSSDLPETGDTITLYAIWNNSEKYIYTYYGDYWECNKQDVTAFNKGDEIIIINDIGIPLYLKVTGKNGELLDEEFYSEYSYTIQNDGAYVKELTGNCDCSDYIWIMDQYSLTYDLNGGSGTVPTHKKDYGALDAGKEITLASGSGLTKTGYTFAGWSTKQTATTGNTGTYTIVDDDIVDGKITLYAIWDEKENVNISEVAMNAVEYNAQGHSFTITGTPNDDFTIYYATHAESHKDSDWSTEAPINIGVYDVKILRDEDDTYKEYSKLISSAITINKIQVTKPTADTTKYIYTGSVLTYSVTANDAYTVSNNTRTDAGSQSVTVQLKDKANYEWADKTNTDLTFTFTIEKAEAIIDTTSVTKTYTYTGDEQVVDSGATLNHTETTLVYSNNKFTNVGDGTYTITISSAETDNYKSASTTIEITVNKATYDMSNAKWDYTNAFTYDGNQHKVEVTGLPSGVTAAYENNAKVDAGTYTAKATLSYDSKNYNEVSIADLSWTINKAKAIIDTSSIVTTYTYTGEEQTINSGATLNHTETTLVYTDNTFTNVGTGKYTITISAAETNNYNSVSTTVEITINKAKVNEPTVSGEYTVNGNSQTVLFTGVEDCMTTTSSLSQSETGLYDIIFTLDNNHEWADGSDGIVTWEIKSVKITPKKDPTEESTEATKEVVIISSDVGFTGDITVIVEVIAEVEVESKEFIVDYYNIDNEAIQLEKNEKIGVVFEVKLIQTINGESKEIQPSDIKEGTTLKIKMLIPDSVDISKVTRILHVHSSTDIEEIEFDPSKVVDGYYEIEVDRLSEFAFVYKTGLEWWAILFIVLGSLILIFIGLFFAWKKEYDDACKKDKVDERKLKMFDVVYLPINNLLFDKKKKL